MGSQVSGKDRSRLPGKETVGKVRREGRASDRTKERVRKFRVNLCEKNKSLAMPRPHDDRPGMSGSIEEPEDLHHFCEQK